MQATVSAQLTVGEPLTGRYELIEQLQTLGVFESVILLPSDMSTEKSIEFTVTEVLQLNMKARSEAIIWLGIVLSSLMGMQKVGKPSFPHTTHL